MDQYYRRNLPHQLPAGFPIFLTWNLKGAMPQWRIDELCDERQRLERQPMLPGESLQARKVRLDKIQFASADRFLGATTEGPLDLRESANAEIVQNAILEGVASQYDLLAWCVMANHVHVLFLPTEKLAKITQRLKGGTAFLINARQQDRGREFWQHESYDHWARDEEEVLRIIEYIENNPVAANLCERSEDWRWSSARLRSDWPWGQPYTPVAPTSAGGNEIPQAVPLKSDLRPG